jgi:hypothetical protein
VECKTLTLLLAEAVEQLLLEQLGQRIWQRKAGLEARKVSTGNLFLAVQDKAIAVRLTFL